MDNNFNIDEELCSELDHLSHSELFSWTELHLDPDSGAGAELQIFSLFLFFTKTQSSRHLHLAIDLAQEWADEPLGDPEEANRRSRILERLRDERGRLSKNPELEAPENMSSTLSAGVALLSFGEFRNQDSSGDLNHLNNAILYMGKALSDLPGMVDQTQRADYAACMASYLDKRVVATDSTDDLEMAIYFAELAVWITDESYPTHPRYLDALANVLIRRFEVVGEREDLDKSIRLVASALEATSEEDSNHIIFLASLADKLKVRHDAFCSKLDIDRAITMSSKIIAKLSQHDCAHEESFKHVTLSRHIQMLSLRARSTGSLEHIDECVAFISGTLGTLPPGSLYQAKAKGELGIVLCERFQVTGSMNDIDRGIEVVEEAMKMVPEDVLDQPPWALNLSTMLLLRYSRVEDKIGINRALDKLDWAIGRSSGHLSRKSHMLSVRGDLLVTKFYWTRLVSDLDDALLAYREAREISVAPLLRARTSNSLARTYRARFTCTNDRGDLDNAVQHAENALEEIPDEHPHTGEYFYDLGVMLELREKASPNHIGNQSEAEEDRLNDLAAEMTEHFGRSMRCIPYSEDLMDALIAYRDGLTCTKTPIVTRLEMLLQVLRLQPYLTFGPHQWEELGPVCFEAISLLNKVSPRQLKRADQQHNLAQLVGLGPDTAGMLLSCGKGGAEVLGQMDQARNVTAGLLLDMREDLSGLKQMHPELAAEFARVRNLLDVPESTSSLDSDLPWEVYSKRRQDLVQKFEGLVKFIQDKPGFNDFLQPPATEVLLATAKKGPIVVVNLSMHRCDAIIVRSTSIETLLLEKVTLEDVNRRAKHLPSQNASGSFNPQAMLAWLWETITKPILDFMGFKDPVTNGEWPHIWWIPTRSLVHFPLHAAGLHGKGTGETVLDRVISSYASSIRSLLHARRTEPRTPKDAIQSRAVLIPMQETPAKKDLPGAIQEVGELEKLCDSLKLQAIKPPTCRKEVLEALGDCTVLHFAGHGHSDVQDPSLSYLLLKDWESAPLTVSDLRDQKVHENRPFLGYLSACSTGSNAGEGLADESVHLINALQLIGFRHVVGTLWEVADLQCVDVARHFYTSLANSPMTDDSVALALHTAVRAVRDQAIGGNQSMRNTKLRAVDTSSFYRWIPYVHFGV